MLNTATHLCIELPYLLLPLLLHAVVLLLSTHVLPPQAALKSFDDDHNGALDQAEFERFAKSLMSTGVRNSLAAADVPAGCDSRLCTSPD
jgi:hypothetical protein